MSAMEATAQPPKRPTLARRLALWSNPALSRFSGNRWFPLWGLLEHRGRRSGRVYQTPVAPRRTADGFVISLAFGEQADWCRNVLAEGGGALRWMGRRYELTEPEIIGPAEAAAAFNRFQRLMLRPMGVHSYMRVRAAEA